MLSLGVTESLFSHVAQKYICIKYVFSYNCMSPKMAQLDFRLKMTEHVTYIFLFDYVLCRADDEIRAGAEERCFEGYGV